MVSFILSELQPEKTITWEFHVDEGRTTHYDLLIGRDLLNEVGIDLLFSSKCISWEGHTTVEASGITRKTDRQSGETDRQTYG